MDDRSDIVIISFTAETNLLMEIGDRQDWKVNVLGLNSDLEISNKACISEYDLKNEEGTFFEISFFPEDSLKTMAEAEIRIKEKHGKDLMFPIRHRKMGTTFTISFHVAREEWEGISRVEVILEFIRRMTEELIRTANKFINSYRLVAGDSYVKNIGEDNCHTFFHVVDNKKNQLMTIASGPNVLRSIFWDEKKQGKLDELLIQEMEPDYSLDRVLLDSISLKNEGNLAVSFITLVTGLEIVVFEYFHKKLVAQGLWGEQTEKKLKKTFLSELLKVDKFHQALNEPEKKYFDDIHLKKIRDACQVRNDIVHRGKRISENELMTCWEDVMNFIKYFSSKMPSIFFNPKNYDHTELMEPNERLTVELAGHWNKIMSEVPEGQYVFSSFMSGNSREHISVAVGKDIFPWTVAEYLASLWPEKAPLTIFTMIEGGVLKPIIGFEHIDGSWDSPWDISAHFKKE